MAIDGETVENRLFFLGSKITVDSNCSHEVKRHLLLGRKTMKNLDSVLKSRDTALPTEGLNSQSHGFSSSHVWIWELDNKKGSALKNWCLQAVVLEKTLESPLDYKEIQPVHLKKISPECSLEGLMLKWKLHFGHLMWRADSLEKTRCWKRLRAGGEGGNRGWDGQVASLTQWTWVWADSGSLWRTGKPGMLQSMVS